MKLEIKNLSKNYGSIQALKDVSLSLENGIYGLLGPNGAGKSTLIGLLTDSVKREKGEINWDGVEIRELGRKYRDVLGYMPQQQGYYEDFTARAFLIYMGRLKGMSGKIAAKKTAELLELVNLESCAKEKIGGFSGGMRQRLLLAQALLNDPKLLILDEPTAGVDPQERIRIRNFISEIATDRIVLLATHIVSDVEAIAKRIILLNKGEVLEEDSPYNLLKAVQSNVYEIQITYEQLHEIQDQYLVSNLRHTANGLAVKIITNEPPRELLCVPAVANLEDVYLKYFSNFN